MIKGTINPQIVFVMRKFWDWPSDLKSQTHMSNSKYISGSGATNKSSQLSPFFQLVENSKHFDQKFREVFQEIKTFRTVKFFGYSKNFQKSRTIIESDFSVISRISRNRDLSNFSVKRPTRPVDYTYNS